MRRRCSRLVMRCDTRRGLLLVEVIVVTGLLSMMFAMVIHATITLSRSTAALELIARRSAVWQSIDRQMRGDTLIARTVTEAASDRVVLSTPDGDVAYEVSGDALIRTAPDGTQRHWPLNKLDVTLRAPADRLLEMLVRSRAADQRGPQWNREFRQCWRLMGS